MFGFLFVLFVLFVQLYSGVFMALVRSVTLDTSDMPTRRSPAVILSSTSTRKGAAKGRRSRARGSALLGRRGGFPHPAPSTVPTGSLETKSAKLSGVQYDLLSGGASVHVNVIAQGTQNDQRIGNKIRCTGLHIKGSFHTANDGPQCAIAGYYVVWDKSPNLTQATPSNVFKIDAGTGYNMNNTFPLDNDRFVVLAQKRVSLGRGGAVNSSRAVDHFIKLPKYCVTGFVKGLASGNIANTQTGALLFMPYRTVTEQYAAADESVKLDVTKEFFFAEA